MTDYWVYIMTNPARTLYMGVTNDLERRVLEHREKTVPGFTSRYSLTRLVYCESTPNVGAAIEREKQLKGWMRKKKVALIESMNPGWDDLSMAWRADNSETLRFTRGDTTYPCHSEGVLPKEGRPKNPSSGTTTGARTLRCAQSDSKVTAQDDTKKLATDSKGDA